MLTDEQGYAKPLKLATLSPNHVISGKTVGSYTVTVSKPGFQRHTHRNVIVYGGKTEADPSTLEIFLVPGEGETTVTESPFGGRTGPQTMGPNR